MGEIAGSRILIDGEGERSMVVRKFGKRKGGVRGEETGGWRGSCGEDCRRGGEGSQDGEGRGEQCRK